MSRIFTKKGSKWTLFKVGEISADLPTEIAALAAALGRPTGERYEIDGTILTGPGWADDLSRPELAAHRPAFDAIVAQIASIIAAQEAAAEAARLAALNAPPPVPFAVTARQLFPVLRRVHGITPEAIEAAIGNPAVIADADDRADALIEFRRAYIIERSNPLIALLAGVFSLTETQIDDAFRAAAAR